MSIAEELRKHAASIEEMERLFEQAKVLILANQKELKSAIEIIEDIRDNLTVEIVRLTKSGIIRERVARRMLHEVNRLNTVINGDQNATHTKAS